ncbi:hypothetical protein DKX38_026363 [Salix brachista]|uniref:Uncharacterized protein n=1 Tax=Salix brachista TaxID=2182728 RepID=A0A5N5JEE7_9ROSI|nr:hypothetical protein DKX38_026363 [Salix brachista]
MVARRMATTFVHHMGRLSKEDSRHLFQQLAFGMRRKEEWAHLEEIGVSIVKKCGGVPLAIKALGNLMRLKDTEDQWMDVKETLIFLLVYLLQKLREGFDVENVDADECSKFTNHSDLKNWKDEEIYERIRDRFVTGDWSKAAQRNILSTTNDEEDKDSAYGDFEDLETGEKHGNHQRGESGNVSM